MQILVFAAVVTEAAAAQTYTGKDLNDWWHAYERLEQKSAQVGDTFWAGHYAGFVLGVTRTILALQDSNTLDPIIALPARLRLSAIYSTVGRYVEGHPGEWGRPAASLVMEALALSYPPPGFQILPSKKGAGGPGGPPESLAARTAA